MSDSSPADGMTAAWGGGAPPSAGGSPVGSAAELVEEGRDDAMITHKIAATQLSLAYG